MLKKKLIGFTIVETLAVIAIIGILAASFFVYFSRIKETAKYARTKRELSEIVAALEHYLNDNNEYPADVSRGLPNGLEQYLPDGDWPNGAWTNSVYDWDNWIIDGVPTYQVSLRFGANPGQFVAPALFPQFDYYSAVYYCIEGNCRAHSSKPIDHPGFCANCNVDEKTVFWGGN